MVENGQVLGLKTGSKEDSQLLKEGQEKVVSSPTGLFVSVLPLVVFTW